MSDDVTFDAIPEENPESNDFQGCVASRQRSPEVSDNQEIDVNQKMLNLKVSDEKKNVPIQPMNDFDADEYTPYNDWFPPDLRKKLNIAIMHADKDKDEADDVRMLIEKNVQLTIDRKCFRPRVELLSNVSSSMKDDPLDTVLKEADFLFVYVTNNFTNCDWSKYQGMSSLKVIMAGDKQCTLMCIHTDHSSINNLPATLNNAPRLEYFLGKPKQFLEDIERQLYKKSDKILTHRSEQIERRRLHFQKYSHNWSLNHESGTNRGPNLLQETKSSKDGAAGYDSSNKSMKPQPDYPKVKKPSNAVNNNLLR
ncbi:unnamed protein product [Candidula unifasciata]|uniref:TIR domain-containing protein n=1 Tax=Candidula unifasciata TaxID=100452 RepID=A0A8S3ZWF7_9EUPU|nr:unnamed protein product [Candidula unifasciata]